MNQIIESFLRSIDPNGITEVFLWLLSTGFGVACILAKCGKGSRFTAYAPTLFTTLGIFGTFIGIVVGLLDFDPTNVDTSIGKLLAGLKTAFITSITGMLCSILFKILSTTPYLKRAEAEAEHDVGPADILAKLDEQTRLLEATRAAVAGSEESSLAGQVKLLRTDLTDQHRDGRQAFDVFANQLWGQLTEFAQMLSKLDEQTRLLEATRAAVAGSEESSLAGQVKLLRTDLTDQHRDGRQAFDVFANQLWGQLTEFAQMLSKLDEQTRLLEATRAAVAGSEESSLAGQVKLLRTDLTDQHRDGRQAFDVFANQLWGQLTEFAQMLSKSATEQVIHVLTQVIANFNQKITEQFGDNFKRLDASVQKLVEWQEGYRQQLEQLHGLYDQSVQNITQIESAVKHIADSSSHIPDSMEKLTGIVESASHQLAELERHLEAFAQLRDRAVEAVPQVQEHVKEITHNISGSVRVASEHYETLLTDSSSYAQDLLKILTNANERVQRDLQAEHQQLMESSEAYVKAQDEKAREMLAVFRDAGEHLRHDTQIIQQQVTDGIQQMQKQLEASINEVLSAQNQAVSQSVERLHEQMRETTSRTGEVVNAQVQAIDQTMSREVERVMNEMGRALAQIAGKFTSDYIELTEAMGRIVGRGRRAS